MQGVEHLYFLIDENNRSLYVENGIVMRSSVPRPLEFTPDGWRNIQVDNTRNSKYFALDRSYTVPLEFVEDGALILKDAYYKNGIEAKVYLGILKQKISYDGTSYGWFYDKFVKGDIDFSNFNHTGPKVTVNIMEGGIPKYIKANESVKYEIDLDVQDAVKTKMDGIYLHEKINYLIPGGIGLPSTHLLYTSLINSEGNAQGVTPYNVYGHFTWPDFTNSLEYFFATSVDLQGVNLKGQISFTCQGSAALYFLDLHTNTGRTINLLNGVAVVQNQTYIFDVDTTFDAAAGEKFFLAAHTANNIFFSALYQDSNFSISFRSRYKTTYVKALQPLYLFKQLVSKVTNGEFEGESDLLAEMSDFTLTCGNAIRLLPGSKIVTTLSDFFTALNVQFNIGLGAINGKVRLEKKEFFIDYDNPIDLGEVSKLKVKPATDYYFNSLNIGYSKQTYDDVNGKDEFNNTSSYTSPITRISKELSLISPYRADSYGIELLRIDLTQKDTTDNSSDNDVFFVHTKKVTITDPVEGPVYELNRDLNPYLTGVLEPETVFNVYLSPRRCLDRCGRFIHSCFYKMDTGKLTFQTADKNADVATTNPAVVEKSDVTIGNFLQQLFSPNTLEFDTPTPVDLVELLDASPVRAFTGTYLGFPFKGIPVKVGIRSSDFEAQTYQLLASPDTDLEPLTQIFE
jgi:hypothetical protein